MRECESLSELRKEFKKVKSGVAGDTIWMAKASLFLIEVILERLPAPKKARRKKSSAWNLFVSEKMRTGFSMKEIAHQWHAHKQQPGNKHLRRLA